LSYEQNNRRVVVTGMARITPLATPQEYWKSLIAGKSGVGPITRFDASNSPVKIAAEVKASTGRLIDPKAARRMARFSQFAVATAKQALEMSGYVIDEGNSENVRWCSIRAGVASILMQEASVGIHERGPRAITPFVLPGMIANMASCQVSLTFGTHGPVTTGVAACASSIFSFVDAYTSSCGAKADMAIAGGTESFMTDLAIASLANMQAYRATANARRKR